jgi:HAD superfamily hydrolase (TIGR01509 family)
MYTTAIFDMDGLLLDSERPTRDAWEAALTGMGLVYDHPLYLSAVGRNLADTRELLTQGHGPGFDFDAALEQVRQRLAETVGRTGYAAKPGVRELLVELSGRGIRRAVASSTAIGQIGQRLRRAGLLDYFEVLAGGDEVRRGKPEPEIFLLAASRLGVDPQTCLVFEDSSYGAQGALAAGMGVVLVPDLKPPAEEVGRLAVRILDSLDGSAVFLNEWFCGL